MTTSERHRAPAHEEPVVHDFLAAAPEGAVLYATSGEDLLTLDPVTGRVEQSVQVASVNDSLPLALAVAVP